MSGLDVSMVIRRSDMFTLRVELAIPPGSTVALLGPNGAGKSTIVDALAGITPLDEGRIVLAGRVLDDPGTGTFVVPEQRRIGVVFQRYLLFEHLSVRDNVAFGPASRRRGRVETEETARTWIEALDLGDLEQRRPSELSGGQAQRVALARALAAQPDLLLLDEPLAALDVDTRGSLRRILGTHLAEFPGPRLLITHDPTDAFLLADRILVLEDGRLTQRGTPEEIRQRPATPYVAALAGTNLLAGVSQAGTIHLDDHPHVLRAADTRTAGPVLVTIHPRAVALHGEEPHGSPRNTWRTTVVGVEPLGDTTRITLGSPLPLGVDVTPDAVAALGVVEGAETWVSVKATEIGVTPA